MSVLSFSSKRPGNTIGLLSYPAIIAGELFMTHERITITASVQADRKRVWDCYTGPEHITQWNFADPSWHCPAAANDLTVGGRYVARMEARDGSFGFDFDAIYTEVVMEETFTYEFGGRQATVSFTESNGHVFIVPIPFNNVSKLEFQPEPEPVTNSKSLLGLM